MMVEIHKKIYELFFHKPCALASWVSSRKVPMVDPVLGLGFWVGGLINRIPLIDHGEAMILNSGVNK